MSGWIAISRDLFEHDFFAREPMSEREAWVWMLAKAAWKDTTHRIGGVVVDVPRGSFFCTLRELQSAWGWASDKRVRTFLKRTQDGRMADATAAHGKTQITICNYDEYQHDGRSSDSSGTQDRTQNGRTKETLNTKQEIKEEVGTPAPDHSQHFADFWEAYPHRNGQKKNRKGAESAFSKAIAAGADVRDISQGVTAMQRAPDVQRGFARDPTTWLNQQGWTDEIPEQTDFKNGRTHDNRTQNNFGSTSGRGNRPDPALEQIARLTGLSSASGDDRVRVGGFGEKDGPLWMGTRPQ